MAAMSPPSNWPRNRLLRALPARNLKQLLPELEHIRYQREQVLLDADSSLDSIFFWIAASSPPWQFTPTAAPSRWQRSAGRVARAFRPFSAPRIRPLVSSSKSREAGQR